MNHILQISTINSQDCGSLSFFQTDEIDFEIKRIYYIYGVDVGCRRGFHAHKKLKQFIWCPYGNITIILDDGRIRREVNLDKPDEGLLIGNGIWREMIWNVSNSVLCVAASEYYKEDDYIRNYDDFLKFVRKGFKNETIGY